MLVENRFLKYFSFLLSTLFIVYVIYLIISSFFIVKNQFIDIGDATYVNQVRTDDYTYKISKSFNKRLRYQIKALWSSSYARFCNIKFPYKINESIARSAKQVVEQNFGDCDDKSNLLISMLKVKVMKPILF